MLYNYNNYYLFYMFMKVSKSKMTKINRSEWVHMSQTGSYIKLSGPWEAHKKWEAHIAVHKGAAYMTAGSIRVYYGYTC